LQDRLDVGDGDRGRQIRPILAPRGIPRRTIATAATADASGITRDTRSCCLAGLASHATRDTKSSGRPRLGARAARHTSSSGRPKLAARAARDTSSSGRPRLARGAALSRTTVSRTTVSRTTVSHAAVSRSAAVYVLVGGPVAEHDAQGHDPDAAASDQLRGQAGGRIRDYRHHHGRQRGNRRSRARIARLSRPPARRRAKCGAA
jgi:hypothetical protein